MTGYDPIISNPTEPIHDPGVKGRIFLHDCRFGYYDFISDVRPDLQCDSDFSMESISSMDEYNKMRQSSIDLSVSAKVHGSGSFFGFKAKASAAYAYAMNKDERAAEKVLNTYKGEIVLAEATCITNSVSISDAVRPVFTSNFIQHLVEMDIAASSENTTQEENAVRSFIREFGTHFIKTTKLGAQLIYERRYQTKSESRDEQLARSKCVKHGAQLAVSGSGHGFEAGTEAGINNTICSKMNEDNKFALNEGFEAVKTVSRGSRPKKLEEWIDANFKPVPIRRVLENIDNLFVDEWMKKNSFYGFQRDVSGARIRVMFQRIIPSYCSLMLEGILDLECNIIGNHIC